MTITDLFSRRQKRARGEVPDAYVYDSIPRELRVQVVHILGDTLGGEEEYHFQPDVQQTYEFIVCTLCREYGLFDLRNSNDIGARNYRVELFNYLLREVDTERLLDAVELGFRMVAGVTNKWDYRRRHDAADEALSAVAELNSRFQQHGAGYRFESGYIVRIDSEFAHAEIVKPALRLLSTPHFEGAEEEFRRAHEHYRHERHKEALTECLKSVESTMKAIAAKRKWAVDPKATAKGLFDLMFEKKLIPLFWAQHFSGLRATLEGGVPTVRNRLSGHGQGSEVIAVPKHIVAFALHQTAAAIVYLVSSEAADC